MAVPLVCLGLLAGCRGDMGDDGAERRTPRPVTNVPDEQREAGQPATDAMQNARPRTDGPGGAAEAPPMEGRDGETPADAADRPANQLQAGDQITVRGCITGAPGTKQLVLRDVRLEPRTPLDPHRDTTQTGDHGVTQGSYIRLQAGDHDGQIRKLAGERAQVTITGTLVDTGVSTIGTAGEGQEGHAGIRTRAAEDEHYAERVKKEVGPIGQVSMADGTPALLEVTQVQPTGQPCAHELVPDVRRSP